MNCCMGKDIGNKKIPFKTIKSDGRKGKGHYKRHKYKGNIRTKPNLPKYQRKFYKKKRKHTNQIIKHTLLYKGI